MPGKPHLSPSRTGPEQCEIHIEHGQKVRVGAVHFILV
jgi:hypothetical protein